MHGFDHLSVALSIGIQRMVRSDKGSSGVMFTLDTYVAPVQPALVRIAFGVIMYFASERQDSGILC